MGGSKNKWAFIAECGVQLALLRSSDGRWQRSNGPGRKLRRKLRTHGTRYALESFCEVADKHTCTSKLALLFAYHPTDILDYCALLGLDTNTEKDLMYIAREGSKAPLPKDWKPV